MDDEQIRADATPPAELIESCSRSFDRVAGLTKAKDSEWLSLDIGMGQLKAMVVLAKHRELTVGGLARVLDISEPSASLLVDRLVTRGLAERNTDPADRRRTLVLPSADGNLLVERLRRSRHDHLALWLAQMDADDLQALARGLDSLADAIERGQSAV